MGETVKLILSLSISGGLFALALFALKPLMRNKLSKSFQYYVWLVVLLRFIVPLTFGINLMDFSFNTPNTPQTVEETVIQNNPANPANISPAINNNAVSNINLALPSEQPLNTVTTDSVKPFDIMKTLTDNILLIWLVGALVSLAFNVLGYWRFIRYIHGAAVAVEMPDCSAKVYKSRFAPTPMLVGMCRPRIYLPDLEYTDSQLDNILRHELTHLRRFDVWLKWFVALVVSAHWFNPIVYFMRREINRACELSCDEAVIRNLDGIAKQSYGDTLISVVADSRYPVGVMSTTMCEEKNKLKERLVAIMDYKKKTKIAILITAVLAVVITGCAFAFGASIGANNQNLIEMEIVYQENPAHFARDMQLVWDDTIYYVTPMNNTGRGKEIGYATDEISTWRIYELKGYGRDYLLAVESEDVWRVMCSQQLEKPFRQYVLENATEKQKMERMLSVTLYNDGTAWLATPPISSFALIQPYYYTFVNNELLIHYEDGELFATFTVIDENTLIFKSTTVLLYAESGGRYVNTPPTVNPSGYDISLANLRQLAAKGDELVFEDFNAYEGQDVGFGLYILHFKVEGGYELLVGGGSATGKPMYATLQIRGVEENVDIRYDDIDEFIGKYHIPNELSSLIYGYFETIMSSPAYSSAAGDYIRAHQTEYNMIMNMGVTALPTLTGLLNTGDMSLRGNIAALLVQDIISVESDKSHSEWTDDILQSAASDVERWSRGFPPNDSLETRDEQPKETAKPPEKAPRLEISLLEDGLSEQRIQTAQLTTSWFF